MSIDLESARQFIESSARVLERHRFAVLCDAGPTEAVLTALRAYQNADGGFGHALEPDVRCPASQPSAALFALDVLADVDAARDPMVPQVADWIASIAHSDGGVPTVLPSAEGHPRAPWMQPSPEAGFLTYALAAKLWRLGVRHPWLESATAWCWKQIDALEEPAATPSCSLCSFLTPFLTVRAAAAVERLAPAIRDDGTVAIPGGVEGEHVKPLDMSPRPSAPSRALFTGDQIAADLDRLENEQLDDGGWDFHFLHFSPGQSVEWRGAVTLGAIQTLREHGRA